MNTVWRKNPATVRDVYEALNGQTGWAYTTVKTFLTRLVEKGALSVTKAGNTSQFSPAIKQSSARRMALRALVDKAFGGTFGPMLHYLIEKDAMSVNEMTELKRLLEEEEADGNPSGSDEGGN